jgi:hypothetical protein
MYQEHARPITLASDSVPAYSQLTMKVLKATVLLLALGVAASGCSTIETQALAREDLKDAQGHVVGYKELLRDGRTGEELAQLTLYVPRVGERGEIIGFEERMPGGAVLRDLYGKRIGTRWIDARTRANNPHSKGLVIMVRGKDAERNSLAQAPSIDELVQLAQLAN